MEQKIFSALTAMLNAFPQTANDKELTLRTFEAVLRGVSSRAVTEAAARFVSGLVAGQSVTFAPSVAEFALEARRIDEWFERQEAIAARQALPTVHYIPDGRAPFEVAQQGLKHANAHRPIIQENASFEQFQALSKAGQLPRGASWVAALATIYGPAKAAKQEAA